MERFSNLGLTEPIAGQPVAPETEPQPEEPIIEKKAGSALEIYDLDNGKAEETYRLPLK